jgi:hypothetical protein
VGRERGSGALFNVIVATGVILMGSYAAMLWRSASRAAEESAQLALLDEAEKLLAAYHRAHGHYPDTLEELAFTYPDGGDRSTLDSLEYDSDGEYYLVKTIGAFSGEERRVCR